MTREELTENKAKLLSDIMEVLEDNGTYIREGLNDNDEPFYLFEGWSDFKAFNEAAKQVIPEIEDLIEYRESDNYQHTEWFDELIEFKYNWGFTDSYAICDNCRHIVDTAPNYGTVEGYFSENDYQYYCKDCVLESEGLKDEIVEGLINNYKNANTLLSDKDFENRGFEKIETEYANGWYSRSDNPETIYNNLSEKGFDVIFNIDYVQPFETGFSVFIKKSA